MNYVIDRRVNAKNKSTVNRQRFLKRYRKQIKRAVDDAVNKRSITDHDRGGEISVPREDISEPKFHYGRGGLRNRVHPGNKEFNAGDRLKRITPDAGDDGEGDASDSGEGVDEFVFRISQREFFDIMFEDLELPNLVQKQLANEEVKRVQAGITDEGIPARLNIGRTMRAAQARRLALTGNSRRRLKEVELILETETPDVMLYRELWEERSNLKRKINGYYSGINVYALGFSIMKDIRRMCENPTEEDRAFFPDIAGSDWLQTLKFGMANFKDDSFIQQFLSPKVIRDLRLFNVLDDEHQSELKVSDIHNEAGYQAIRNLFAKQYSLSYHEPDIQVQSVDLKGDRSLILRHTLQDGINLHNDSKEVLKHLHRLWQFDVHLEDKGGDQ